MLIPSMQSTPFLQNVNTQLRRVKHYSFSLADLVGTGNYSHVYAGRNQLTGETVAIKVVELSSIKTTRQKELLRTEIDVLTKLNHPNIIKCYQVFTSENRCYIITEFCNDGDLDMRVKKKGVLTQQKASGFIRDILQGLSYLAEINVVHRDLKVANVLISNGVAKIADFGFALFSKQKFRDLSIGSPLCMSPQGFLTCIYGSKTDIWAFGILIFELLHGDTPYSFCKLEVDLKYNLSIPFNRLKIKPTVSPELREVICRCLQIDENKRISIPQLKELLFFRKIYKEVDHANLHKNIQAKQPFSLRVNKNQNVGTIVHFSSSQKLKNIDKSIQIKVVSPKPIRFKTQISNNLTPKPKHYQPEPDKDKDKACHLARGISTDEKLIPPSIQRQRIKSIGSQKAVKHFILLNNVINFKVAVNVLHYCRSTFRCIQLMIAVGQSQNQIKYLTGWLIIVLQELNQKLNQGEIALDGESGESKAQKLRQVRNMYERKYINQLQSYISNFINKPSLEDIKLYLFLQYRKYDIEVSQNDSQQLFQLAHLIVLLYDATRLLKKCEDEGSFNRFSSYKDLENILNWDKQKFNESSYRAFKKRMVMSN